MVISQKSLRLLLLVLLTVTGTRWQDPGAELEASRRGGGDGSCCSFGPLQTAGRETPIPVFMAGASAKAGEMQPL